MKFGMPVHTHCKDCEVCETVHELFEQCGMYSYVIREFLAKMEELESDLDNVYKAEVFMIFRDLIPQARNAINKHSESTR